MQCLSLRLGLYKIRHQYSEVNCTQKPFPFSAFSEFTHVYEKTDGYAIKYVIALFGATSEVSKDRHPSACKLLEYNASLKQQNNTQTIRKLAREILI